MDNRPIGIFDSGVGGLTVASQVINELENEEIVYFGDTARVPYGNKSRETVTKFSLQDVRFLLTNNVKAIIVACNTASSNCIDVLRSEFDIPIFGVVKPGVEELVKTTKNGRVGVIGTVATIRSDAYRRYIEKSNPNIKVFSKACPLFVPLAEESWVDTDVTRLIAEKYLGEFIKNDVDSIVLGCTHYPLLKDCLNEVVGDKITLVDPAMATAVVVREYLSRNNMLREADQKPEHKFFVSDLTDMFDKICDRAIGKKYTAREINIEAF